MSGPLGEEQMATIQRIVAKALSEADSRSALLADPHAALAAEGVALPPGMALRVQEEAPGSFAVTLEAKGPTALSDGQLDAVTGGIFGPTTNTFTHTNFGGPWSGLTMRHHVTGQNEQPIGQTNVFGTLSG